MSPDDAQAERLRGHVWGQEHLPLDDHEVHVAVCEWCSARVALPYAVGADWCCCWGCYASLAAAR